MPASASGPLWLGTEQERHKLLITEPSPHLKFLIEVKGAIWLLRRVTTPNYNSTRTRLAWNMGDGSIHCRMTRKCVMAPGPARQEGSTWNRHDYEWKDWGGSGAGPGVHCVVHDSDLPSFGMSHNYVGTCVMLGSSAAPQNRGHIHLPSHR